MTDEKEKINNPLDDELLKDLGLEPGDTESDSQEMQDSASEEEENNESLGSPEQDDLSSDFDFSLSEDPSHEPENTEHLESAEKASFTDKLENLAQDMPVQLVAVLAKRTMSLRDLLSIRQGEVLEFKKLPQESIDLVANGKLIAKGELVLVDGKIALQIKQIVD